MKPPALGFTAASLFPDRQSITTQEFADAFACSEAHVKNLITSGKLTGEETSKKPRRFRISIEALDAFIAANSSAA